MSEQMNKALENAIAAVNKNWGKGSLRVMKDAVLENVPSRTTGSIKIDEAIGIGGVPKGRVIEIFGPEASGKTTLALQIAAQAQQNGENIAFIDVEQAMSMQYASDLGINIDNLIFSQPDSGEETLDVVQTLCTSGAVGVIVVDSVAAMQTQAEIDGDIGDAHIGQVARLMSTSLKKIISAASNSGTTVIFINQIRDKINAMGYGEKTTTTGGNALKFYSSVRLDVRRIGSVKQGENIIGNKVKIEVKKNKVGAPFKKVEVEIIFGKGISSLVEILDYAIDFGIVEKSGAWFSYNEEKIGQGKMNVLDKLDKGGELEHLFPEIKAKVLDKLEEQKNKDK